jgi:hypothetical protein
MLESLAHFAPTPSPSSRHWLVVQAQICQLIDADRFTIHGPMPHTRAIELAGRLDAFPLTAHDLRRYRQTCLFDGVDAYADDSDPSFTFVVSLEDWIAFRDAERLARAEGSGHTFVWGEFASSFVTLSPSNAQRLETWR